jgi:hypothetical protein
MPTLKSGRSGIDLRTVVEPQRVLSHEDVARKLLLAGGRALDYGDQRSIDRLREEIEKELQRAFDLGFRAAGGSVG